MRMNIVTQGNHLKMVRYIMLLLVIATSCTKHEGFSLSPKLGEKGNGVTIQGVVYHAKTYKPVPALVELGHLNIKNTLPIIELVNQQQCDSSGVFRFTDVAIIESSLSGYTDDIVTNIDASFSGYGLLKGVKVKYENVFYTPQELPIFYEEAKELYELEIWLY